MSGEPFLALEISQANLSDLTQFSGQPLQKLEEKRNYQQGGTKLSLLLNIQLKIRGCC